MEEPQRFDVLEVLVVATGAKNILPEFGRTKPRCWRLIWDCDVRCVCPKANSSDHVFSNSKLDHSIILISEQIVVAPSARPLAAMCSGRGTCRGPRNGIVIFASESGLF